MPFIYAHKGVVPWTVPTCQPQIKRLQDIADHWILDHISRQCRCLYVMQGAVPADTLLVYHNAAFPRLKDCRTGTHNGHEPLGHQTHVMQLNNAGRQVMSNRTR